jgi:hypothetical protein
MLILNEKSVVDMQIIVSHEFPPKFHLLFSIFGNFQLEFNYLNKIENILLKF